MSTVKPKRTYTRNPRITPKKPAPKKKAAVAYKKPYAATKPYKKKTASSMPQMTFQRSLSYMNPFGKTSPPYNSSSFGASVTLNLMSRATFNTSTSTPKILIFNPSARGTSANFLCYIKNTTSGVVTFEDTLSLSGSPTYSMVTSGFTPHQMKPLRAAIRLSNTTQADQVGGLFYVINRTSPINFDFTAGAVSKAITTACFDTLVGLCLSSPDSLEIPHHNLISNKTYVATPAVSSSYNSYGTEVFVNSTFTNIAEHQAILQESETDMPMSFIVMYFPITSVAQNINFTLALQTASRYATDNIMNNLSRPPVQHPDKLFDDKIHASLSSGAYSHLIEQQYITNWQNEPPINQPSSSSSSNTRNQPMTDAEGLRRAYESSNNNFVNHENNTLYISGTHSISDAITDLTIPIGNLRNTARYRMSRDILEYNRNITRVVGHSLGAAIGTDLIIDRNARTSLQDDLTGRFVNLRGRMYGSPTLFSHPNIQYYRHPFDPVSIANFGLDTQQTPFYLGNPHSYEGY